MRKSYTFFIALILAISACVIHLSNAAVGEDLRLRPPVPAPVKLDGLRPAVEQVTSAAVTRAILRSPNPNVGENVANYFREVGKVFASMETNANFSAEHVETNINALPMPLEADNYTVDVKTLIVTLYKLAYADRGNAEVPPVEWLGKVCVMFRTSITNGLKGAGRVGL